MDYAQNSSMGRRTPGILVVVALHVVVGYALVTGLARKVVDVIKQPLETKIIEEVKKVVPDTPPPPPPKLAAPPPPFVPPPEIEVQVPVQIQQAPAISTTTAPPHPAPSPRPVSEAPAVRNNFTIVSRVVPVFPRDAIKKGIERGEIVAHVYVARDGSVRDVKIIRAKPERIFDREVIRALSQWRFAPDASEFIAEVPLEFKLTD